MNLISWRQQSAHLQSIDKTITRRPSNHPTVMSQLSVQWDCLSPSSEEELCVTGPLGPRLLCYVKRYPVSRLDHSFTCPNGTAIPATKQSCSRSNIQVLGFAGRYSLMTSLPRGVKSVNDKFSIEKSDTGESTTMKLWPEIIRGAYGVACMQPLPLCGSSAWMHHHALCDRPNECHVRLLDRSPVL